MGSKIHLINKEGNSLIVEHRDFMMNNGDIMEKKTLEFVEHNDKTNQSYPVDMHFTGVKYMDNDRVVLHGHLTLSLRPFGTGMIEYDFNTHDFYRVSYSDITKRCKRLYSLIPHNEIDIYRLLSLLSNNRFVI